MLVFPYPTNGNVNISYNYGTAIYNERSISIYNELGNRVYFSEIDENNGTLNINTLNWAPGIYIIRMEGDGQLLQTQRLVSE